MNIVRSCSISDTLNCDGTLADNPHLLTAVRQLPVLYISHWKTKFVH